MKVVNLLEFINSARDLFTLDYARCNGKLVNFLDLMTEDEQFTQKIDLGLIYVNQKSIDQYTIVDGLNRIVSLSLLLHAVCECYKKTTEQNAKAIKTIRSKYLIHNSKSKLHLNESDNELYNKIINGERLSGHEKAQPMFVLLHNFWSQIKEERLQAAKIFTMLKKVTVTLVETDNVSKRNLYYKLNNTRDLNQIALIEDFLKDYSYSGETYVIGGASIYNSLIDYVDVMYLTEINKECLDADSYFPDFDREGWRSEVIGNNTENGISYKHVLYKRR